jgi:hypothetical protein
MFGEDEDVTRVRRMGWLAIAAAVCAVIATLVIGANAFASQSGARCGPPTAGSHSVNSSWRAGAFKAVGCHAWRHMHHPARRVISHTGAP